MENWQILALRAFSALLHPFGMTVILSRPYREEERDGWMVGIPDGPARLGVGRRAVMGRWSSVP